MIRVINNVDFMQKLEMVFGESPVRKLGNRELLADSWLFVEPVVSGDPVVVPVVTGGDESLEDFWLQQDRCNIQKKVIKLKVKKNQELI